MRLVILEVAEKFKRKKYKSEPLELYVGGRYDKKSLNGKEICTMYSVDDVN